MVGSNGIEPSTSCLSGMRSNHLSYEPILLEFDDYQFFCMSYSILQCTFEKYTEK